MRKIEFPIESGYSKYYTKEESTQIKKDLAIVLKKYESEIVQPTTLRRLVDQKDSLFKLVLNNMLIVQRSYELRTFTFDTYRSYPELKSLYSTLKKYSNKVIKTKVTIEFGTHKESMTDEKLVRWIQNQLLHEITKMNLPSAFGLMRFIARTNDNEDVLKMFEQHSQTKPIARGLARYLYCQSIVTFLDSVVTIQNHEGKYLSDQMVKLLYEILIIMKVEIAERFNHESDEPASTEIDKLRRSLKYYDSNPLNIKGTYLL